MKGCSQGWPFLNYELRITNYELRITNYELRITNMFFMHPFSGLASMFWFYICEK